MVNKMVGGSQSGFSRERERERGMQRNFGTRISGRISREDQWIMRSQFGFHCCNSHCGGGYLREFSTSLVCRHHLKAN